MCVVSGGGLLNIEAILSWFNHIGKFDMDTIPIHMVPEQSFKSIKTIIIVMFWGFVMSIDNDNLTFVKADNS